MIQDRIVFSFINNSLLSMKCKMAKNVTHCMAEILAVLVPAILSNTH